MSLRDGPQNDQTTGTTGLHRTTRPRDDGATTRQLNQLSPASGSTPVSKARSSPLNPVSRPPAQPGQRDQEITTQPRQPGREVTAPPGKRYQQASPVNRDREVTARPVSRPVRSAEPAGQPGQQGPGGHRSAPSAGQPGQQDQQGCQPRTPAQPRSRTTKTTAQRSTPTPQQGQPHNQPDIRSSYPAPPCRWVGRGCLDPSISMSCISMSRVSGRATCRQDLAQVSA